MFTHELFKHELWAPFKQRVLDHVAAVASPTTHLQIALAADNAGVAALGTGMLLLNSAVSEISEKLTVVTQQVASLAAAPPADALVTAVRHTLAVALQGGARALQEGDSLPNALSAASTLLALPAGTPAVQPPAQLARLPRAPAAAKPETALGSIKSVKRLYTGWFDGDAQTGCAPVKDNTQARDGACVAAPFG